jgi:hypothetical protein
VFVARFFKEKLPNLWFNLHRGLLALTMLLTLIGLGGSMLTVRLNSHFQSSHGILGFIFILLSFGQSILGVVIDKLFDATRKGVPIRDKAHWYMGYLITFISLITMFLGHASYGSSTGVWVFHLLVILGWFGGFAVAQRKIGQTHDQPVKALPPTPNSSGSSDFLPSMDFSDHGKIDLYSSTMDMYPVVPTRPPKLDASPISNHDMARNEASSHAGRAAQLHGDSPHRPLRSSSSYFRHSGQSDIKHIRHPMNSLHANPANSKYPSISPRDSRIYRQ